MFEKKAYELLRRPRGCRFESSGEMPLAGNDQFALKGLTCLCVIWLRRGSLFGFDPEVLLCSELWLKQLRELQGVALTGHMPSINIVNFPRPSAEDRAEMNAIDRKLDAIAANVWGPDGNSR